MACILKNVQDVVELLKSKKIHLEATLKKISKFSSPKHDVIKIAVDSPSFTSLNKKLKTLDFSSDFPNYKPHCTIAYVKKGKCDDLIGNNQFLNVKIKFDSILFSDPSGRKTKIDIN